MRSIVIQKLNNYALIETIGTTSVVAVEHEALEERRRKTELSREGRPNDRAELMIYYKKMSNWK